MSGDAGRPGTDVEARRVEVRAVWESLASPMAVAFVTDDHVALVDGAGLAALAADGDDLCIGDLRIGGSAAERRDLLEQARHLLDQVYLEMGDVDVVAVDGVVELRRTTGDGLQESAANEVADLLKRERDGWRDRGVNYAKWSFSCGGRHFMTTPLRAAFVVDRIAAALGRAHATK